MSKMRMTGWSARVWPILAALFWGGATPVAAQTEVHIGNVEIGGYLEVAGKIYARNQSCLGVGCATGTSMSNSITAQFEAGTPQLWFIDDNTGDPPNSPDGDWAFFFNDQFDTGTNKFAIFDASNSVTPFVLESGAGQYAMRIAAPNGYVGMGVHAPLMNLHVSGPLDTAIRVEQTTGGGFQAQSWDLLSNDVGFFLRDVTGGAALPFRLENGAPENAFVIDGSGAIGLGTNAPGSALHLLRNDGQAQVKVEEISGTQTARALVNLVNNGRPDIVMANTGTGKEWAFGAGSNFVLKTGAVGSTDAEKTLHLKLFGATGNMEITGQIITGGGTCGGGCDRVFSPDYKLPSIAKHAEEMFAKGYLPNVGPTVENQPINVSDKLGRMLNELEHAHIYIAKQERRIVALEAMVAQLVEAAGKE